MQRKRVNKKGILALADTLVHEMKRYDQDTFGQPKASCGTVCCLAGHAYAMEVGVKEFNKIVKQDKIGDYDGDFYMNCIQAGKKLLGIQQDYYDLHIFGTASDWPKDLSEEYGEARTHKAKVIVALKALSRLRVNGTIDPDPKSVHTCIPQLKELCEC